MKQSGNGPGLVSILRIQAQVWYALMLHDIKSRFFGNGLGYLVTIIWPFAHIVVILIINQGRLAAHGSSMILYAATGVVPFVTFNYIARFIMNGASQNKTFLNYTLIHPIDIMISRAILETIANFIVVVILMISLTLGGLDVMPINPGQAVLAWAASVFLGIGFGFLNGVIAMAFPLWMLVSVLFFIGSWISSGVILDPESLPSPYGYYLSFNPLFQAVEWMRLAYYPDFQAHLLDKAYLLKFAAVCLFAGIITSRYGRAILLQAR